MLTPRPSVVRGIAVVLLIIGMAAAHVSPSWASADDVTWGVRTGDNDNGTARQNYAYEVDPGDVIDDTIAVTNHGATSLTLAIYAADGFTNSSGQLNVLNPGEESTQIGAWTTTERATVTLQPDETQDVPFQVSVPENASPGDYAGAIVTSLETSQDSGVSVDRRLGIRIHLQVGGELAPAMSIESLTVDYEASLWPFGIGPATVQMTLRNTGNARLAARGTVTISGLGWSTSSEPADVPELLPGETWTETIDVVGVIPSIFVSADGRLVPVRPDGTEENAVTATLGTWAIPWLLIGIVAAAALAAAALAWAARRRRRRGKEAEEKRIADAVEAALQERDAVPTPPATSGSD
ncbi:hypothetical protein GCM10009775_07810 [Microbacterium aoyamense]|uniref:WxL Interacting Protein peptidoglycan binding domain-containing protein n=1 Tax=Microbacterium aoyamense TaxID=344166 RepID=A0ABP5AMC4_9MICO|nr:DUF916 domain-containing protein [Microbacterium aoyamense]